MEPTAYFELNFKPNIALVTVVRRFVSEFYQRFLSDPDGTSRLALATHELLENAVRYSKDGESTIRIDVEDGKPKTVRIVLRNRATQPNIGAIREILDGVAAAPDPTTFYQQLMVKRAGHRSGSGLGLARICAEGEMALTYTVEDNDLVTISAVTSIGERS